MPQAPSGVVSQLRSSNDTRHLQTDVAAFEPLPATPSVLTEILILFRHLNSELDLQLAHACFLAQYFPSILYYHVIRRRCAI